MIAVFINPGRTPEQPEPTPANWGDRDTNRPTEYNTLDDKYARVDRRRADAGALQGLQHLEGSGAARHRRRQLRRDRRLHGRLGAPERLPQGAEHRRQLREPARRPRLRRHRPAEREEADPRSSCRTAATTTAASDAAAPTTSAATGSYQNVRLMQALTEKGYDVNYTWGINTHGQRMGGPILPGDDALAVARPAGLDRRQRHDRAQLQRAQEDPQVAP